MKKSTRYLLALCIAAVTGVLALQVYWIVNYYRLNKATFQKEVNLAMEDAVKKEFSVRCDTIEQHLFHELLDSNSYYLNVKYDSVKKTDMFTVANAKNHRD